MSDLKWRSTVLNWHADLFVCRKLHCRPTKAISSMKNQTRTSLLNGSVKPWSNVRFGRFYTCFILHEEENCLVGGWKGWRWHDTKRPLFKITSTNQQTRSFQRPGHFAAVFVIPKAYIFWTTPRKSFQLCLWCFKAKHLFLTLTTCFWCLNLTRPVVTTENWKLKQRNVKYNPGFAETFSPNMYWGGWVVLSGVIFVGCY